MKTKHWSNGVAEDRRTTPSFVSKEYVAYRQLNKRDFCTRTLLQILLGDKLMEMSLVWHVASTERLKKFIYFYFKT
jgi:hypothetical protein